MGLRWTDCREIASALEAAYPDMDVRLIRFTDLWQCVTTLPDFADAPAKATEKDLEAIQMAWLEERE